MQVLSSGPAPWGLFLNFNCKPNVWTLKCWKLLITYVERAQKVKKVFLTEDTCMCVQANTHLWEQMYVYLTLLWSLSNEVHFFGASCRTQEKEVWCEAPHQTWGKCCSGQRHTAPVNRRRNHTVLQGDVSDYWPATGGGLQVPRQLSLHDLSAPQVRVRG